MNRKTVVRLMIDLAMTITILFSLAYRVVGPAAHEWLGITIFVLSVTHNVLNWGWYRSLLKGSYRGRRLLNTIINMALLVAFMTLTITGILLSRNVFAFMQSAETMEVRQIHTFAAYWGFMLVSIHLGLHWGTIIKWLRIATGLSAPTQVRTAIARVLTMIVALAGVIAFIERDMWPKLFQNYSFDAWNPEVPAILFFAANLSIMGVCVAATYYGQSGMKWRGN